MRSIILRTRNSFWFLPAVLGLVAIVLAEALVAADRALIGAGSTVPFLDALSASGGRSILTIIGSSMLTVAGTSFSITISVLATTSSTYGPRLVRNFLADRANQIVLAVFTSTFLYALVVLRSVRTAGDSGTGFVPTISIHVAVLFGVVDVAFLVFFIHHIADSVQITTLQKRVQGDLEKAVDLIYPEHDRAGWVHTATHLDAATDVVYAKRSGYVQEIDLEQLRDVAVDHDCVIQVTAMPGTHRIPGEALVKVSTMQPPKELVDKIRAVFTFGPSRTPDQDVRFALQQLVEISVRGLASGTNDPYTAVTSLDLAASALVPLWSRAEAPTALTDEKGTVRVLAGWPAATQLITDTFDGIETYGMDHPIVIDSALHLLTRLHDAATPTRKAFLDSTKERLTAAATKAAPH